MHRPIKRYIEIKMSTVNKLNKKKKKWNDISGSQSTHQKFHIKFKSLKKDHSGETEQSN